MKRTLLLALLLLSSPRIFGAAPDKLDGNVYYETVLSNGPGMAKGSTTFAVILNADGTFSGLFRALTFATPPFRRTDTQIDGTYSYKKIDEQTGRLILDGMPLNGGDGGTSRTLQFTADAMGTIPTTVFFASASFRFAPLGARAPLSNCSNRSFVRAGGSAFTGFVVNPAGSGWVLVRAAGPALAPFGIADALRNPRLNVVRADNNSVQASNDDWSSESAPALSKVGTTLGAFAWPANSKDSAVIMAVVPGAYIAQVDSPEVDDSGQALIEVYLLP